MALSTGAPVGPLQARYDAAGALLGYFTAGGTEFSGGGGGSASIVLDVLEADLPAASASNDGLEYQITDRRGGCRVKSNGVSWVEQAPAIEDTEGVPADTWANRGSGTLYDLRYVTHASWNRVVRAIHDGTRWVPDGGRQLLYSLEAPLTGTGTTTYTITLPNVTIPGGLLGTNGALDFELASQASTTPVAATPSITFDGYELAGNSGGANRRIWLGRRLRNQNAANAQTIYANAGATGAFEFQNNDHRTNTKNTANDLVVAGTVVFTHATSITGSVVEYKIWWLA